MLEIRQGSCIREFLWEPGRLSAMLRCIIIKKLYMKPSFLMAVALVIFTGCNKQGADNGPIKDANIITYSIHGKPAEVIISSSTHNINVTFPDSIKNAVGLIAD